MNGYKVLSHNYRPPIRGGKAVWNGEPGAVLPKRGLDTSDAECGAGWNFTRRPETALRIAGLWPTGQPSVLLRVQTIGEFVERGDKLRAESLRIMGAASDRTLAAAVRKLSEPFGEHARQMARDMLAWRRALARPRRDETAIVAGLQAALEQRGLDWSLKRFDTPRAAWAARDAWDARDSWDAWDAWAAWAARAAWVARAARAARDVWVAWDARVATWETRAARDARVALVVEYAALMGRMKHPHLLTTGLRDAYSNGLGIAVPSRSKDTLGWAVAA